MVKGDIPYGYIWTGCVSFLPVGANLTAPAGLHAGVLWHFSIWAGLTQIPGTITYPQVPRGTGVVLQHTSKHKPAMSHQIDLIWKSMTRCNLWPGEIYDQVQSMTGCNLWLSAIYDQVQSMTGCNLWPGAIYDQAWKIYLEQMHKKIEIK